MRAPSQLDRHLQRYAREYSEVRKDKSIDVDDFVDWILDNERWQPDPKRIKRMLREDVSHALSEERFTDGDNRRVRKYHFVKRKRGTKQLSFAFPIEFIKPKDMKLSLQNRRNDLVSRAIQIHNDQTHYNKFVNKGGEPIQTSFDLTYDVLESDVSPQAADRRDSSSGPKRPSARPRSALRESS